ncbi:MULTISPECIES: abortive infection protein [Actinomadura]|uniref:Abortive infection protein n=1 Tax=Actinomadura yumaensis TaxID=111807 RepID=A0ABW2CE07_9ACTN|nr:abortive infection protein [Actinomadura sp. J1-007]MWK33428.1 abortive infection protein [Actinomadura sp. J1-007]
MGEASFGRRSVLAGGLGAVALTAASGTDQGWSALRPAAARADAAPAGRLPQRGVNYDTEREVWRGEYVRREMRTIRRDLHCNAVILLGSDLRRLREAAEHAAAEGMFVWFEPRKFDHGAKDTLAFVLEVARYGERLRRRGHGVGLSLGCELTIFMDGLVPGRNWEERGAALGTPEAAGYNERLNAFLAGALKAVRPVFGGRVTYSSGVWEEVRWRGFDAVGVDLYRDASNEASYERDVRALHRFGKPVVITEFGCCTYRGADERGGDGFQIIDWAKEPPVVRPGYVRDERTQSAYISELLDVYEAQGVYGAFVYNFIESDSPHNGKRLYDYDMAGFSLVKVLPPESGKGYAATGHFEPKQSFHTVARRFAP